MEKKKICVCGHFGTGHNLLNGQTIKTKILNEELVRIFGESKVSKLDTFGGWKALFRLFFAIPRTLRNFNNLIILPAHKGIFFIVYFISLWKFFFRNCTVHYVVIGGWLPKHMQKYSFLRHCIFHSVNYIYAETSTMQKELKELGFHNALVMPNFKDLCSLSKEELKKGWTTPFPLCIFSRVMKQKGIANAVNVVKSINEETGTPIFTLDIYGPIWPDDEEWFKDEEKGFSPEIKYRGFIDFDHSVDTLKNYFLLLFPTLFPTEGVPGTIIDAYAAGLPVVAAKWNSFADVVEEGITGFGFEMGNEEEMKRILQQIAISPDKIDSLRENCLEKANSFKPSCCIAPLTTHLK